MSYEVKRMTLVTRVSRHNSEADRTDDEAWERLRRDIQERIDQERYAPLWVDIIES